MRVYVLAVCLTAGVMLELATLGLASHGHDYSVCNTTQVNPSLIMLKPNISEQFHTRVEAVIVNKNKTVIVREYFDAQNNRGFVRVLDQSISMDAWYDYNTNEFIAYYPMPDGSPGLCQVQDLSKTDQRFLFGYQAINGQGHIYSAAGALHYGGQGIEEAYMGKTTIRNINVDWWRSCQYWKDRDATMTVDWYFTSRTTWDSTVGIGEQLPVQAHVTGMVYDASGAGHHFEHYYNFFDFKPYLDRSTVFETPAGVTCPGRKLTRKFPAVPSDAFSFTTEIVDVKNDILSFMKETFYYSQKLVKYEYRPQSGDFSPYGTSELIEIHDFHSGLAYVTDKAKGNCSVRAIESGDFDVRSSGPNTVRIRNAKEFFYLDTTNVSYEGIKQNRGLDCDTWIANRNDYPFGDPSPSTWEWYFATSQWQQANAGPEPGAIPVQMRITIPQRGWMYQYNIYHFQKSKPDLLKFDISGCYQFRKRRKFQFMVPAKPVSQAQISSNVEVFKYYVLQAIMSYTNINPLRVAHLQAFFADNIIVTFELLDVSPIMGDTQRAPDYSEVPLDFAANTIAQMIQDGQFVINLKGSPFTLKNLVATPNSIVEITYLNSTTGTTTTTTGYGAGPMAAVGVTMPLLGGGLGVLFAYFFFK